MGAPFVLDREFVAEKLHRLYPYLDTKIGSTADIQIIQPIVAAFGDLPPDDFEDFIITRLNEFNPDIVTTPGSANYDILISTLTSILEPLRIEIDKVKNWQSIQNYDSMPTEELDALAANYFVSRLAGSKATGVVRVYFSSPISLSLGPFNKFTSKAGYVYRPIQTTGISKDVMSFNQDSDLYFIDVRVQSDNEGTEYNILKDNIVSLDNSPVPYVKVTNLTAFTGGAAGENNEDLYTRMKNAITVRNLVTKKSINYQLLEEFNHIKSVEVVGFGDRDMERDLVACGINTTTTITQIVSGNVTVTLDPVVSTGASYTHVGGHVDVYAYTDNIEESYLDITNLNYQYPIPLSRSYPYRINTPVLRIAAVERLDPLYLTSTSQYIPKARPIDVRALRDFAYGRDEYSTERALGTLRIFFDLPTSMEVNEETVFTAENGRKFYPVETQTIAASGMVLNTGQNITKSTMDNNVVYTQDIVYYYFDVVVQSYNSGDTASLLSSNAYLTVENYISEGWYTATDDPVYSFSTKESIYLIFSETFNDGIETNGEAIRVIYEWAPTIKEAQDYVDDDEVRVVTTSTLMKHFQPAYVDIAISYEGSPEQEDVEVQVRNFINGIGQGEYFEISDLVGLLYDLGATRVIFPIEVFVLTHDYYRNWTAKRFNDRYATPRRTHFLARNVDINKL